MLVALIVGCSPFVIEQANDPDFLDDLENNLRPDLCITAAYGQYLPKRFLAIPKFGAF